jgi:hypothetical protein
MVRWRVDFIGKVLSTPSTVEAPDEKSAIAEAADLDDTCFRWFRGL